jgi:hypothetical protein
LLPAGRIVLAAVDAGFSNAHDYLVNFETGESQDVIDRRKEGRGWTKATGAIDRSLHSSLTGVSTKNFCTSFFLLQACVYQIQY